MGNKGMARKFKCSVCGKLYAIDNNKNRHEIQCRERMEGYKKWEQSNAK